MKLSSAALLNILRALPQPEHYHVAFSGGLDSTVLVHLMAGIRHHLSGRLHIIHVHHGLQAVADDWSLHCERFCNRLDLPIQLIHLGLTPQPGESLEAQARDRRYQALAGEMQPGDLLLTAQHQDDQAETLLLQLLRGSGPAGLAGMPRLTAFTQGWLARPLLDYSRAQLEAYATEHQLEWVDDPSNQDQRFDRNYLRHQVIPLLQRRWPSVTATLARSAAISAEVTDLLDEQAAADLSLAWGNWPDTLSVSRLRGLSLPRRKSLLRHWVRELGQKLPASRHLQRINEECIEGRSDAQSLVRWADVEIRRYRDNLFLIKPLPTHDPTSNIPWLSEQPLALPADLGQLHVVASEQGISASTWRNTRVEVRFRLGGEVCMPAKAKHHQSLKKLLQSWGIPPWLRDRIPLIYLNGSLAAIPGRLLCEPFVAAPGEPALKPVWIERS